MLKKIFTNDTAFRTATLFCVIANIALAFLIFFPAMEDYTSISYSLQCCIEAVYAFFLYQSYIHHDKNVMKGLLGSFVTINLFVSVAYLDLTLDIIDLVISIIVIILSAILAANHFLINWYHQASPKKVKLNQAIAMILICINGISWFILPTMTYQYASNMILDIFTYSGKMLMIIYIESKLDEFRLDREAAGWTEESGYPENYVHQKDRH